MGKKLLDKLKQSPKSVKLEILEGQIVREEQMIKVFSSILSRVAKIKSRPSEASMQSYAVLLQELRAVTQVREMLIQVFNPEILKN